MTSVNHPRHTKLTYLQEKGQDTFGAVRSDRRPRTTRSKQWRELLPARSACRRGSGQHQAASPTPAQPLLMTGCHWQMGDPTTWFVVRSHGVCVKKKQVTTWEQWRGEREFHVFPEIVSGKGTVMQLCGRLSFGLGSRQPALTVHILWDILRCPNDVSI